MELYTRPCYNPYFIDINGRTHQIDIIKVFNDGVVIASTSHGWFGSNNNMRTLTIDVECVSKRKIDLNCKTAFVVKCGEDFGESRYALYIPNSAVGLNAPTYEKVYSNSAIRQTIQSSFNSGILFEKIYWLNKEVSSIEHQITELGKEISSMYSVKYERLPALIEELSVLNDKRLQALERMCQITIDDFVKTIPVGG